MDNDKKPLFSSKALDYFLQMAETMNYTKAATILGISQPALTQQIKKIEKNLGSPLFYSTGKILYLTDVGHLMLQMTHSINTILNTTAEQIQQSVNLDKGEIKIGLLSSVEDKVFTQFINAYYKSNPDIKITLYMLTRDEIWNKLENNILDLAIMYLPDYKIKNWKSYVSKKIVEEELLFIHHNVEMNDQTSIKLIQTINKKWAIYPDTYYINEILRGEFKNQLTNWPTVSGHFTTPEQLYQFSKTTESFTALPSSFVEAHKNEMDIKSITFDPTIVFDLSFIYRHDKKQVPRINNFLAIFTDYLEKEDYYSRLKTSFSE